MKRWVLGAKPVVALFCAGMLAPPVFAQAPVGAAEFRIDSAAVASALGDRKPTVEASLSAFVAEQAEQYFGFVDWSAGESNASGGFALILHLSERPVSHCPPDTRVQLENMLGSAATIASTVDLYEGCDPKPPYRFADLAQFENDVRMAIEQIFDEPGRKNILGTLLARVSLTNTLKFDHARMQVLLPFRMQDLKASEESQLTVQFTTAGTLGSFRLRPFGEIADNILCEISRYRVASPLNISADEGFFWHPSFEQVFPQDTVPAVNVFMTSYVANPFAGLTVGNGIVAAGP